MFSQNKKPGLEKAVQGDRFNPQVYRDFWVGTFWSKISIMIQAFQDTCNIVAYVSNMIF